MIFVDLLHVVVQLHKSTLLLARVVSKGNTDSAVTSQTKPVTEVDDKSPNSKAEDIEKPVDNCDAGIQNTGKTCSTTDV